MSQLDDHLQARAASLHEEREGKHLFVWGDLGQWLVVDAEAALLIERFGQGRRVDEAVRDFARMTAKPAEAALREALPVVDGLVQRGILGWPPPPPRPPEDPLRISNLTFNLTNRCNLRCAWCYNPRSEGSEVPVPDLIRWISATGDTLDRDAAFIILGGEPFLDQSRLLDTIRGVRRRLTGEILVSTNGTLLDPATPSELAQADATVQISLDSPRPGQHDAIRGRGVFDRAVSTARRLVDAGVRTVLSMVMTRGSEEQFEAYFDLASRIGVDEVRFIPLRRIGGGVAHSDDAPDLHACFQRLVEILGRRPELSRLLRRDFFSILMTVCRFSRLRGNCGVGRRCLFVDADGSIFPCPNHRGPEHHCGNVRTTPLAAVLEASTILRSLRARYRVEEMRACHACEFRFWCAGDCRAEALAAAGTPGAPSPYCRELKMVMKEMFWLIAEGWQALGQRDQTIHPWS